MALAYALSLLSPLRGISFCEAQTARRTVNSKLMPVFVAAVEEVLTALSSFHTRSSIQTLAQIRLYVPVG
jgi:hypothetical protein